MVEAFNFVRTNVLSSPRNRPGAQDLIIFITDGFANPPRTQALVEITTELKEAGTRIFAVGITNEVIKKITTFLIIYLIFVPIKF